MDFTQATKVLNGLIAFIIALITNEIAQGYMARSQGDNTPEQQGRLTFNPIPHLDPFGSVLFPLFGAMFGGFIIGWPKPMPINTSNMRDPKWSPVLTALAGPGANLILSFLSVGAFLAMGNVQEGTALIGIHRLLGEMVFICAIWAFFQLIPLPPLAGSELVSALLPHHLRQKYEALAPYSMIIFLLLIFSGAFVVISYLAQFWTTLGSIAWSTILN